MKKKFNLTIYQRADEAGMERLSVIADEWGKDNTKGWMDTSSSDYIVFDRLEAELEFNTIDENQLRQKVLDGLRKQKEGILDKAMREAEQIEDKIQQLMAIEAPKEGEV